MGRSVRRVFLGQERPEHAVDRPRYEAAEAAVEVFIREVASVAEAGPALDGERDAEVDVECFD
jgi:hypothetical protein